jgi:hypothetical protein
MQDEIFDVFNKWKPLLSSNTSSSKDIAGEAGRPEKQNKTNAGDQTAETDQNYKR